MKKKPIPSNLISTGLKVDDEKEKENRMHQLEIGRGWIIPIYRLKVMHFRES